MIEVSFVKTNRGYEEFHSRDHAKDQIVCAAVSALAFTLAGALKNIEGVEFRQFQHDIGMDIAVNPMMDDQHQLIVDTVFKTVLIGLRQIEKAYPDKVRISVDG